MQGLADGFPQQFPPLLMLLHILPFQTTLSCPSLLHDSMSSSAFLPLSYDMLFFTQSPSSFCNTCQSHLNWFRFTTSDTNSIPILSLSSALGTLIPHGYTTHPSYHPHLCSLQSCTLLHIHCPCLTSIHHYTPHTRYIQYTFQ